MAFGAYSETNLANSLATYLAAQLLDVDYLVYWARIDAVQTPTDGWWLNYTERAPEYAVDPVFGPLLTASRGVLTVKDASFTNPEYPTRPISEGAAPSQADVPIPSLTVEIQPRASGRYVELGSRTQERFVALTVAGWARDEAEERWLTDRLAEWFDRGLHLEIKDHDSGSLAVIGAVEITASLAEHAVVLLGPATTAYEVMLTARLKYEA